MRFESEDASERRYTGVVTGIGEVDPVRWPGSKWRCLLVSWDDVDVGRQKRVSPWEIEPIGSLSGSNSLMVPGSKRTKISLPSVNLDIPLPSSNGDLVDSGRFHKVLQGQEIMGSRGPLVAFEMRDRQFSENLNYQVAVNDHTFAGSVRNSDLPYNRVGFEESIRFHKVLQGQEVSSIPLLRGAPIDAPLENVGFRIFGSAFRGSQYKALARPSIPLVQVSSPSSVLMFQQASSQLPHPYPVYSLNEHKTSGLPDGMINASEGMKGPSDCLPRYMANDFIKAGNPEMKNDGNTLPNAKSACRLFGFSLADSPIVSDRQMTEKTEEFSNTVRKQGSVIGRLSIPRSLLDMLI